MVTCQWLDVATEKPKIFSGHINRSMLTRMGEVITSLLHAIEIYL